MKSDREEYGQTPGSRNNSPPKKEVHAPSQSTQTYFSVIDRLAKAKSESLEECFEKYLSQEINFLPSAESKLNSTFQKWAEPAAGQRIT